MLAKNYVISTLLFILICSAFFAYKKLNSVNTIETPSAHITVTAEDIPAGVSGVFEEYKVEQYQNVKAGDTVAVIVTESVSKCTNTSPTVNETRATQAYEDAALMYKDGVITQEQYDKSLEKYKKQKSISPCKQMVSKHYNEIKSTISGKIELEDIQRGENVNSDIIIGRIQTEKPFVTAYFSPKYKKQIKAGDKAEISIIKYPEKNFSGTVIGLDKIDIFGQAVSVKINEDVSDLNLKNNDAVTVKIMKD